MGSHELIRNVLEKRLRDQFEYLDLVPYRDPVVSEEIFFDNQTIKNLFTTASLWTVMNEEYPKASAFIPRAVVASTIMRMDGKELSEYLLSVFLV